MFECFAFRIPLHTTKSCVGIMLAAHLATIASAQPGSSPFEQERRGVLFLGRPEGEGNTNEPQGRLGTQAAKKEEASPSCL